jgi:(p)ppGpp synthase/HD superfamily hydrolase
MANMTEGNMLIPRARDFSFKAHAGLITVTVSGITRPHIMHIQEVADLVWASNGTDEEIAAAWLHDVVEDTKTTMEDIRKNFGDDVAKIVDGLTDSKEITGLPVAERKQRQAERVKAEGRPVQRVKIADQTSNVRSLALDPTSTMTTDEIRNYIEGAKKIADACRGVSPLLDRLFEETYLSARERFFDQ